MNAVNLIPIEDRRGAGAPGRSGGAVYAVLGALGVVLLIVAAMAVTDKQVKSKQDEVTSVTAQAEAAEAQAGSLQAYTQFASLRDKRQQTVAQLASSRFDWSHSLHELARVLPAGTTLTTLRATVSPSVQVDGGAADPLRSALSVPAMELAGCATSQDGVAEVLSALRRMDGVQRVSLSSSETSPPKAATDGSPSGSAAGAGTSSDCRGTSQRKPQFSMTVFFSAPQAQTATAGATGAAATTTSTTTATTATTTPAPAAPSGGTK